MYLLILSFLLFYSSFAIAENPCITQSPCRCVLKNNTVIDLSSVGSSEYIRFHDVAFKTDCIKTDLYSYNPCFAFNLTDTNTSIVSGNHPCSEASACVKTLGKQEEPLEEHVIGQQHTGLFDIESGVISIKYRAPENKNLQVNLRCDESLGDSQLSMDVPECKDNKTTVLVLTSKCACANGCLPATPSSTTTTPPSTTTLPSTTTSGLSTGSKLLIAFFTILLAYLLIGVVWNYCNGSHGIELIPNIEFWNGLPTLIMEGVVFTCSCCTGKRSYGEV